MTLVRWRPRREWDPFAGLLDLPREFSNIFAPVARMGTEPGEWAPPVDLYSDDNKVVVEAEVPGLKQEEIDVSFDGGVLTIKGERKHEAEFKDDGYSRIERCYGAFQRSLTVPAEVDAGKIKADLKDGVLTITLPKAEESKARKIKVEAQ